MEKTVFCSEKNREVTIEIRIETLHNGNGPDKNFSTPSCSETNCPYRESCKHLK